MAPFLRECMVRRLSPIFLLLYTFGIELLTTGLMRGSLLLSSRATKADPQSSSEPQSLFGHGRRPSRNWPVFLDAISKMGVPPAHGRGANAERDPHASHNIRR